MKYLADARACLKFNIKQTRELLKKTKTEDAALLLQTLIKCEAHLKDKTITTAEKLALANALPVLFFQIPKLRIKNV